LPGGDAHLILAESFSNMKTDPKNAANIHPTEFNIAAIAKLEEDALSNRTRTERASDAITKFAGSFLFLLLHVFFVSAWIFVNLGFVSGLKPFDPFPFGVLSVVVSSEAVFLTIFVLISQNRMVRQAEKRAHLDLQVGMLAEQELTTLLQMQQKICQRLGVSVIEEKDEVKDFAKATDVHQLARELDQQLPKR
jgi:uncharacterized membrane protein